jgi:hypothetical protein
MPPGGYACENGRMSGQLDDPEEEVPRHWVLDLPDGLTVEDLAADLIAEATAVTEVDAGSVFVRRVAEDGSSTPWAEITAEMRRRA